MSPLLGGSRERFTPSSRAIEPALDDASDLLPSLWDARRRGCSGDAARPRWWPDFRVLEPFERAEL